MSIQRLHVGPRLSEVAIHNGVVYLAGQVAEDSSLDITGQTQQVLAAIDRLLAEAGSDKAHILSLTIYLKDMADYAAMNAVYIEFFRIEFAVAVRVVFFECGRFEAYFFF